MSFIEEMAITASLWGRFPSPEAALDMLACVCSKIRFIKIKSVPEFVFCAAYVLFVTTMKRPWKYFK